MQETLIARARHELAEARERLQTVERELSGALEDLERLRLDQGQADPSELVDLAGEEPQLRAAHEALAEARRLARTRVEAADAAVERAEANARLARNELIHWQAKLADQEALISQLRADANVAESNLWQVREHIAEAERKLELFGEPPEDRRDRVLDRAAVVAAAAGVGRVRG